MSIKNQAILNTLAWVFLAPLLIMLVWNWWIPSLFALPEISYWAAFWMRTMVAYTTNGFTVEVLNITNLKEKEK